MMKCVFFPFTQISTEATQTVSAFFEEIEFLALELADPQAGSAPGNDEMKPLSMPVEKVDQARRMAAEYQAWAEIHKGNEHNLKALLQDNPYFTSESHIPSIKSQIRGSAGKTQSAEPAAAIEKDILFLMLAAHADRQQERLDQELAALDQSRAHLISELRGEEIEGISDPENEGAVRTDPGSVMTGERIRSWNRCMALADGEGRGNGPALFVTTSPAVYEYLETNCTDVLNALDITDLKVHENNCKLKLQWRHRLFESLVQVVEEGGGRTAVLAGAEDGCRQTARMKLSFFSGEKINTLFNMPDGRVPVCLVCMERQNT